MHKYVKMLQKCKKVRCSTLSMSTPVTSLFFFKPIIGGGGCLRGVWADGAGRGKAAPPQPPSLGRPHGLGVACVGLVLAARVRQRDSGGALERGSTVLRAADAHLHRVRRMPSRPQRQAVGGVLRLRFAKTWPTQAPSKQRLVGRSAYACRPPPA